MHLLIRFGWMAGVGLGMCFPTAAQLVNQNQTIVLSQGSVLSTSVLRNEGSLYNNGEITATGDWLNNGTYHAQTGMVRLSGTSPQRIRHGGQDFHDLRVSGGDKLLEDSAAIANRLMFEEALMVPLPGSRLLMRQAASLTGASAGAYVAGQLCWEGTGERFYAVGGRGVYAPAWLSAEPAQPVAPVVGLEMLAPAGPAAFDSSLSGVSGVRHWRRTVWRGQSPLAFATLGFLFDETVASLDSVVVAAAGSDPLVFRSLGQAAVEGTVAGGRIRSADPANASLLAVGIRASSDILYVPNAFAPASASAEEQVFKVYGTNLAPETLRLVIYNRWGNVVFRSQAPEQILRLGWDGRHQTARTEEAAGTYTYTLQGRFRSGKSFQQTGTVTLLR